jgi:hypothetical protein
MMATATIHNYDTDREVARNQVNLTRWHLTKASTGTGVDGVIVWFARSLNCCPTQAGWPVDRVPGVWDTTGTGTVELASYVQCGGCGSLIYPAAVIMHGAPDDAEIAAAGDDLAGKVVRAQDAKAEDIRRRLCQDLSHTVEDADREALPVLDGMAEPGIGADGGELVAWDYDPHDPSGGSFIEVREGEL